MYFEPPEDETPWPRWKYVLWFGGWVIVIALVVVLTLTSV